MEPNETSAGAPSEQNDATMQNDSNMTAETPSVDVAVGAEAIVASEEIAESGKTLKDDTVGGMMAGGAEPKKNGKGMVIGMILFALLAVGGIGFGVWAMMDGNSQKSQVEKQLNAQIDSLKQQNDELTEKIAEQGEKPSTKEEKVDAEDYIYVGEWGIKIKIPEGLNKVSYELGQLENGTILSVIGVKDYDGYLPNYVGFGEVSDTGVLVKRISSDTYDRDDYADDASDDMRACGTSAANLIFSSDGYNYCKINSPAAGLSNDDEWFNLWVDSSRMVNDMLSDPENYSVI